nr:ABC transporter ATP-binding protein [uncultured Sellimonas sp.]
MSVIEINHITKNYGNHKGLFDVNFSVEKGEIVGFLEPNGAGKTTLIRHLMGFIKPDSGTVSILGKDCFHSASEIQKKTGYLPGEIAFLDDMTGDAFLKFVAEMKQMKDLSYMKELCDFLELNPKGRLRRMSKGMKQKIGIIIAFMDHPEILLLDEPTSGLDPLMQNKFVELIQKEKQNGTTILMSSHMFEEVENTCNRVVMIREGQLIADENMDTLLRKRNRICTITFDSKDDLLSFVRAYPDSDQTGNSVTLETKGGIDSLIKELSKYTVRDLQMRTPTLEELFLQQYGGRKHD